MAFTHFGDDPKPRHTQVMSTATDNTRKQKKSNNIITVINYLHAYTHT